MLEPIYELGVENRSIELTIEQKEAVRDITLSIGEVDRNIREMAVDNVIDTLENGHPLNRIIEDKEGNTISYIACENFVPNEAYIKYFGTTSTSGRNLLREIPAFLEYAKEQGYAKINFHGWNDRLNHIMERYGFSRKGVGHMGEFSVDYYEVALGGIEQKTQEEISKERARSFEQKYLDRINKDYDQVLAKYPKSDRDARIQNANLAYQSLFGQLQRTDEFVLSERGKAVLRLKLARHFQTNDSVDINVLRDAIIEKPKFLQSEKGSIFHLFEVHERGTVQRIAEMRKARAEITGNAESNPYEAVYQTVLGKYYLARLLNMAHLEKESSYINHCVGTSTSYANRMKKGDIEIFSFRTLPQINPKTHQFEGSERSLVTIEYNLRTKTVEQMKKAHDEYIDSSDPFYHDLIEALKALSQTETDFGKKRDFAKISESELVNFKVTDYHLLTENGEVHFRDFDPDSDTFVLKMGSMNIIPDTPKEDAVKLFRIVEGIEVGKDEIAYTQDEVNPDTKAYIGDLFPGIFQITQLEHIYISFPEGKVVRSGLKIGAISEQELRTKLNEVDKEGNRKINISDDAQYMIDEMFRDEEYQKRNEQRQNNPNQIDLVRLKVRDLGILSVTDIDQIEVRAKKFGLDFCPAEVGLHQRLKDKDHPLYEWYLIAMKTMTDRDGYPNVFSLERNDSGLWLDNDWANPDGRWNPSHEFMFRLRQVSPDA